MPPSRLVLPLCGLLLALVVTAATASAPLYGPGELRFTSKTDLTIFRTREEQVTFCAKDGGSLVPMVTEAVYTLVTGELDSAGAVNSFSYMGGSTMLSSSCTSAQASLNCIWYWDVGRYTGTASAVSFYKGNRGDPAVLPGAAMIGTSVSNHWRMMSANARCPCGSMWRHSAFLRVNKGAIYWSDTIDTSYTYEDVSARWKFTLCAIEQSTTTKTTTTTTTTTTTSTTELPTLPPTPAPPTVSSTTTTADPVEEGGEVNVPLVVGISVGVAVALIIAIAVIVSLVCCGGCSCTAGAPGEASESAAGTASQWESMSRATSFNSRASSMGEMGNRSFHEDARSKNGSSRYSSARGFGDDMASWRDDDEVASMMGSQYVRTPSTANMAPQMMPPQMMPPQMMPPQMMPPQMMPPEMMQPEMMQPQMMQPQMMQPQGMPM